MMFCAITLLCLAGCGHQTDEQVLEDAVSAYSAIAGKYNAIVNSEDNKEVVKNCKRLGRDFRTNSFWYSANVEIAEIAPLHRALYIVSDDTKEINHLMGKLEGRILTGAAIYSKLHTLLEHLHYTMNVIRDTNSYVEEARVLEQRRIEQEQLEEARRQRYAMETIAYNSARPIVIKEEVIAAPCHSCSACPRPNVMTEEHIEHTNSSSCCGQELAEITVE